MERRKVKLAASWNAGMFVAAVLAEQIRACPEAGRGQVILTTHSPDLLDLFLPESIRVVEMDIPEHFKR